MVRDNPVQPKGSDYCNREYKRLSTLNLLQFHFYLFCVLLALLPI